MKFMAQEKNKQKDLAVPDAGVSNLSFKLPIHVLLFFQKLVLQ
jgi:hypothetical protein